MASSPARPQTLDDFRPRFAKELTQFMAGQTTWAQDLDPLYGELLAELSRYLARGGKRLRPYLMYLSHVGLGGPDDAEIVRLSVSQELYHNAWLIHDDLIDRDLVRHGGPNIAGVYRAKLELTGTPDNAHLANAMALIAGDVSLVLSSHLLLDSSHPVGRKLAAVRRMQEVSLQLTGGEMLDVLMTTLAPSDITAERLLGVYHYKTAAYSFELPLHAGAILAGAGAAALESISAFAIPLGIAFQIADDLLGTFGNEQTLGKPVLSDLREGKRTILLLHGLALADPKAKARLEALLGDSKAGYRHLAEVRKILEDCGARAKTEDLARDYLSQALEALATTPFSPPAKAILKRLASYMIERSN